MTLTQIHHFVEIVKHGSINAAAMAFYISYQAMHKSLKNLERELNIILVNRDASGITLTKEGELFYQDAIKILEMENHWLSLSQSQNGSERNLLKIYTTQFFITTKALDNVATALRSHNIFADILHCRLDTINNLLLQEVAFDNVLFLTHYHPIKNNIKLLVRMHNCKIEYLCSDFMKIYCNRHQIPSDQKSISVEKLKMMKPILFSNDFLHQISFNTCDLIDYNKPYYIAYTIEEMLTQIQIDTLSYTFLRSAMEPYISEKWKADICALDIEDLFTGVDYYAIYPKNLGSAGITAISQLKNYCTEHFCQIKYFD